MQFITETSEAACDSARQPFTRFYGSNHSILFGLNFWDFTAMSSLCHTLQVRLTDVPLGNVLGDLVPDISIRGVSSREEKSNFQTQSLFIKFIQRKSDPEHRYLTYYLLTTCISFVTVSQRSHMTLLNIHFWIPFLCFLLGFSKTPKEVFDYLSDR